MIYASPWRDYVIRWLGGHISYSRVRQKVGSDSEFRMVVNWNGARIATVELVM